MPTQTFHNLSEEKRRRIFEAAVQEFAARRFSEASINQIIKAAGISRGSFYQYFRDKEDLYLYVLAEIGKEKMAVARSIEALHPEADLFDVLQQMVRSLLLWARERPLYNRIAMLMEFDDSEFIIKLRKSAAEGFAMLRHLIERDKQRGRIKPEVDTDLIIEVYYTLMMHVMKEHYRSEAPDEERLLRKMAAIYQLLKEGIARV